MVTWLPMGVAAGFSLIQVLEGYFDGEDGRHQ